MLMWTFELLIALFKPMLPGLRALLLLSLSMLISLPAISADSASKDYGISNNERINIMGRYVVEQDNSLRMSYPGVTISFVAQAKRATLSALSESGNGRIDVIIDNKYSHTIELSKDKHKHPLFFNPQNNRHTVHLINRTESWQSINQVFNLELLDGDLLPAPRVSSRKLLLIGDSVTCGSGVSTGKQCDTHIKGTDARNSYGYLLGEKLDANVHLVCFGGRGIIRSWDENPKDIQAPAFFEMALPFKEENAPWDHQQYQPDAIIISLGTNDFNPGIPDRNKFVSTYIDFVRRLASVHPKSNILITEGAMLNDGVPERPNKTVVRTYMKDIEQRANVATLSYEPANHYPGDACDPHPTAGQHEKMAQDLEQALRERLGW
ncbi:GDSL-type esterase/lipase family protein [Glaciecola siphonariae]|uniref:GDSL-type esterase/lipase family protein n=1 Tax=Glaciecola siphonariae TaxID=521012 RepID=A0ABV9M0B5_9ALTE